MKLLHYQQGTCVSNQVSEFRFRLRTDHASLIWLCKRAERSSQVARWLEILAEFSYRIKHQPGKKHGNADGLSRRPDRGCKQCHIEKCNIEKRDGGPPRSELEALIHPGVEYDWDQGQLQQKADTPPEVMQNLRTNPVLAGNVRELRKLQESLRGVVADVYRAKKEGRRPSEEQLRQWCAELRLYSQRWHSLRIGPNDHDSGRKQQTPGEEEGSLPSCHPPGVDMGRPQTGSCRSPEGARQITNLVVLA